MTAASRKSGDVSLVSSSQDGTLIVWDTAKGRPARTLRGHRRSRFGVFGVRAAPAGKRVASWADDRTVRVWDPGSGKELATVARGERAVAGAAFHPSQPLLAAIVDEKILVIDLRSGKTVVEIPESTSPAGVRPRASLQFSPSGAELVCVSGSTIVEVFNASSGKCLREWSVTPAKDLVYDAGNLQWSPKGKLFGFTYRTFFCLSSIRDGKQTRRIDVEDGVHEISWMPSGDELIVAAIAGLGRWTADGKRKWWCPLKKADGSPMAVACAPDGRVFAEGGTSKLVRVRTTDSGEIVATCKGHIRGVTGVTYVSL